MKVATEVKNFIRSIDVTATSDECLITKIDGGAARLQLPVYCGDQLAGGVVMETSPAPPAAGAFEIWQPTGNYGDLGLSGGFYGDLERFQNVSSFVRFEPGVGLPGQVWNRRRVVVHEDLSTHKGFLRSAGASAESLETAIGIPVGDAEMSAAVVLLTSATTPIADGIEVWSAGEEQYELSYSHYIDDVDLSLRHTTGASQGDDHGLVGLAVQAGGPVTSTNGRILDPVGVSKSGGWIFGAAIPVFENGVMVEILNLLTVAR